MTMQDEIKDLEQKALMISTFKNKEKRHHGGMYLHNEIKNFDDKYNILNTLLHTEAKVELMAVIAIVFDVILADVDMPDFITNTA